jgi:NADH pyrophosphatase NudC (nudix superfamily)
MRRICLVQRGCISSFRQEGVESRKEKQKTIMNTKHEAVKTKLLARAEAAIDKMLEDERVSEEMTLSAIEAVIGVGEIDFRQAALEEIIDMQTKTAKVCPLCGGKLHNKGKQHKQVVSRRGEVRLERNYYECCACRKGYFPPRSATWGE